MIEQIRQRLSLYRPAHTASDDLNRAAVLIPLYAHRDELHVILTKRTDKVEHHKGQISFPGGAFDPTDADLVYTALRESHEEIGLVPEHVEVIGQSDDMTTATGFHVSVFIGSMSGPSPYPWRPYAEEVAEIIEVPLPHLLDPRNTVPFEREFDGIVRQLEAFKFGDHLVWGATHRMLRRFLDIAAAPE